MKCNRIWRSTKRVLAASGVQLRLKPLRLKFDATVAKAGLWNCYTLLYRSRKRVLLANLISGVLIAFSVYSLAQSSLPGNLIIWMIRILIRTREFILAGQEAVYPPYVMILIQGTIIALSAGICAFFSSIRKILLLNSCLIVLILVINFSNSPLPKLPMSSAIVVLLIMAGALFDYYFEQKFQRRLFRHVADKQQTEHAILRHISHSINPTIQMALSPLRGVLGYLAGKRQTEVVMALRRDGSSETVGAALETAITSLQQIREIMETTESIFGNQLSEDDFEEISLADLFAREITPLFLSGKFELRVNCSRLITLRLHRPSLVQAIKNIIRNAEVHGFPDGFTSKEPPYVSFDIKETVKEVLIDCSNNGVPFPSSFKTVDFLTFGVKGKSSPGKGLGGAWVKRFIEIHGGSFQKLANYPVRFRIILPKRRV